MTLDELKQLEDQLWAAADKLAAKDLIIKLVSASPKVLIEDWWKDVHRQAVVKSLIEEVLDRDLPSSYDEGIFKEKVTYIFDLLRKLAMNDEKWAMVQQSA